MKTNKIIYWIATGLLSGLMLFSAAFYLFQYEEVKTVFEVLGYPTYIVLPLALLKIAGVAMILWRKSRWLTEWAYAGFFFDALLAFGAHLDNNENTITTLLAMLLVLISYFFGKTVRPL